MAHKLLDEVTAVGASRSLKVGENVLNHTVYAWFESLAATAISAVTIVLQGSSTNEDGDTGVITNPTLAIGSTKTRVANSAFNYRIQNTNYSKGAVAAGTAFSAAHVISANLYGCIDLFINSAGTINSVVPLATQAYASAALAHAAADASKAVALTLDKCWIGRLLIQAPGGGFTANTTDLDATTSTTYLNATSSFLDITSHAFSAGDITAQKAMFFVPDIGVKYVRLYLSTLTGTGTVSAIYSPIGGRI